MKTTNFLTVIALAAALLFSACNKTEPENPNNNDDPNQTEEFESTAIVFTATVDGGWEGVSSVAVMIDDTVKEYSVSVSDADNTSATLSSDDPHYWTSSDDISVTAWWPYTEGETTPPDVVVNADQSTQDGFEGSKFISTEDQTVAYDNPTLTFTHRTARVTVELTVYTEGLASVKLTNLSTDNGNPGEIVPYEYDKENLTYVAHLAPQTVNAGTAFITCELDNGETFVYEMPDATEWNAGEEYTYNFFAAPDYTYDESTNAYTVYKAGGLLAWNQAVQSDLTLNCTLAFDIDLTGIDYEWLLVGNNSNRYTGTFEGGGHSITGLTVNQEEEYYVGLIGGLGSNGKVQNLMLDNVNITGFDYVGGVVGTNNGGTVTDCSVSGSVSGSYIVGGVVGYNFNGSVTDCYHASGSVSGSGNYVGGVVGYNFNGSVTACYSTGSVSGSGDYVGGVAGANYGTVTDCSASGSVSGSSYVGGVVGQNYGNVAACTASGSISGNSYNVGGVVGYNSDGSVTACYHISGNVSGSNRVGGVVGYTYGSVTACYHASGSVTGSNVGGVVGYNYESAVIACYWSDYDGSGIGDNDAGTDNTTKVDGSDVTWADAVEGMNSALQSRSSDWRYELTGDLPTLKKNE